MIVFANQIYRSLRAIYRVIVFMYRSLCGRFLGCLFVSCLFGIFRPTWDFLTHMETSPLLVRADARHSSPLSSEGSLACKTYCDTGHPFIMVISEDPRHSHLLPSVWYWSWHYLFLRLRSVAAGIRIPNLRPACGGKHSNPLRHRRGLLEHLHVKLQLFLS